jgi:crotonobetainyl-CoA:carnitine CoA-transferase CaiB-like acyl-CoA transferase
MGHYHNQICPAGVYKGPQGWIFILVLDRQWSNMAKAMGRPELRDDPRFAPMPNGRKMQINSMR